MKKILTTKFTKGTKKSKREFNSFLLGDLGVLGGERGF